MVYAREHDLEGEAWIGHPDGGGWPIFREGSVVPTFDKLRYEPRTRLQHFPEIEARAGYCIQKWEGLLGSTVGLSGSHGPASANRQRYTRAIRWWRGFLDDHRQKFPEASEDRMGSTLTVDESGPRSDIDLLPQDHGGQPVELGPIEERCDASSIQAKHRIMLTTHMRKQNAVMHAIAIAAVPAAIGNTHVGDRTYRVPP